MDIVSRQTFTALEAVLYIACHPGTEPVRSRDICAYQAVAVRYLEPMLQKLVRGGILRGVRGPKGGYLLAKERRKIGIDAIVKALQDDTDGDKSLQSELRQHIIHPFWGDIRKDILLRFEKTTLHDLVEDAKAKNIHNVAQKKSDFTI